MSSLRLNLGEQAHSNPSGVTISRKRDDRHAHPQCLAGRGGAVVWEGIEGNIYFIV